MIDSVRAALNTIWRSKLFAVTAVLAFSLGIGATTTVFSVIDAVLLRPAAFSDPGSIVRIQAAEGRRDWDNVPPRIFSHLQARSDLFAQVAGSRNALFTVTHVPVPDQVFGQSVTGNLFSLVDTKPLMGRALTPDDDRPDAAAVLLLSYQAWQQLFSGDPAVVGNIADMDGEPYTVAGVMPRDFVLPGSSGALWTTLRLSSAEIASDNARMIEPVARLWPTVPLAQAQAALNVLANTLERAEGKQEPERLRITAWHDETEQTYKVTLWLALGMVSGLLIIACANLSSILLARAISRQRDYAIRLATGASRLQLIRQSMIELCLLSLIALAIGCAGAAISLNFIRDHLIALHTGIPNVARIQLNGRILLFSFGMSLFAAFISGVLPAISATSIDLSAGLRESGTHASTGNRVRRLMYLLISVETAISMMLLLTSGLLVRSLMRLLTEDHGIRPHRVLTVRLPSGSWQSFPPPKETPEEQHKQIVRYMRILAEAENIHGVESAALASSLPLSHVSVATHLLAPDEVATADAQQIMLRTQAVTRDYFRVMGIPLLAGRTFDARDANSKLEVVLVNQAFTRDYFHGENPVGKHLRSPDTKADIQIIGLVKDSPHLDYAETIEPQIYVDFEQKTLTPFLTGLVVRTREDPERLVTDIRSRLSTANPSQAVVEVRTLQTLVDENIWRPRFSAWLFSAFAFIALSLASIGIYGVITYVTMSRKRDFGIRLALGADAFRLFRLATIQSLAPVLMGAGMGHRRSILGEQVHNIAAL